MGVQGLWQLLESTGKAISPDHLSGKVLAVDISMWLHQLSKGMRDSEGNPLHNAHLIGLFKRICKLLYYGIKPIFVFDGSVPILKRQTMSLRQKKRDQLNISSRVVAKKLLRKLLEKHAIQTVMGVDVREDGEKGGRPMKQNEADIFILPSHEYPLQHGECTGYSKSHESGSVCDDKTLLERYGFDKDVDFDSKEFQGLPSSLKLEMLVDFKEKSKQLRCNYGLFPQNADDFSGYQIEQLMKSNEITERIENLRREINKEANESGDQQGDGMSRIFSDADTRFVYQGRGNSSKGKRENIFEEMYRLEEHKMQEPTLHAEASVGLSASETPGNFYTSGIKYCLDERFMLMPNVAKEMEQKTSSLNFLCQTNNEKLKSSEKGAVQFKENGGDDDDDDDGDDSDDFIEVKPAVAMDSGSPEGCNESLCQTLVSSDVLNNHNLPICNEVSTKCSSYSNQVKEPEIQIFKNSFLQQQPRDVFWVKDPNEINTIETCAIKHDANNGDGDDNDMTSLGPLSSITFPNVVISDSVVEKRSDGPTFKNTPVEPNNVDKNDTNSHAIDDTVEGVLQTCDDIEVGHDEEDDENMRGIVTEFIESFKDDAKEISLEVVEAKLSAEVSQLRGDMGKNERESSTITEQIQREAQDLLRLFGVPFLVSPAEAEAQCAFLDSSGQADGTITDDSDVFLFGAKTVIRHLFNQHEVPELYSSEEIEKKLFLDQSNLICIAMLCGSDYTTGIRNVGPVTATEIIQEFKGQGMDCLLQFRNWWLQSKKDNQRNNDTKVKSQLRRLHLFDGFPSPSVFQAYKNPLVNTSTEAFSWNPPELKLLERYALETLHWTKNQADDMIIPLAKKLESYSSQRQVTDYFKSNSSLAPMHSSGKKLKSKRLRRIINVRKTEENKVENKVKAPKRKGVISRDNKIASKSRTKNFVKEMILSEESSVEDCDQDLEDSVLASIDIDDMLKKAACL